MSERYQGGFVSLSFNPLGTQTTSYLYNLLTWGNNAYGNLGLNNTTYYSSPKQVGTGTWTSVAANVQASFAIKGDGTLWAWGYNSNGSLGQNNTIYRSSPVQVGALTNWSTINAGKEHVLAIKTDGTLWSWGLNNVGQLGVGSVANKSSPVQVGSLTTWLKVAAGYYSSMALKTDGTLWAWGYNYQGILGQAYVNNVSSPVQVGALTNWASPKYNFMYNNGAVKTDGTLWTWGPGAFGGLGHGNTTTYSSPKQVGALTNWLLITGTYSTSLAIKTDGTLWSWGYGNTGVLGLGNTINYSSPKQVGALTNWVNIVAGRYKTCMAKKSDGSLWAWGNNTYGELGLGNQTNYSSPKQVGLVTTWNNVAIGNNHTVALG